MAGMKTKIRVITTFARISASTPCISEERVLAYKGSIPPGRVALLNYLLRHADCLFFIHGSHNQVRDDGNCMHACDAWGIQLLLSSFEGYMHGWGFSVCHDI